MKKTIKLFLYWTPRVLSVLFALFISLFALDVFVVGRPFLDILASFLIHLVPTAIVVGALILACRYRAVGGVMFIMIGAAFIFQTRGFGWGIYLAFGGIPILIGILFMLEGFYNRSEKRLVEDLPEGEE